ncbi:MAG: DUF1080 domain-containing protein, partial [Bacteroidia bacterium]|nr:DUF1080 domain-containing protein [Bacteroidia bacterium]
MSLTLFSCGGSGDSADTTAETDTVTVEDGEATAETEAAAPNTLTSAEEEEGWLLLFDGQSTENWKGYCKDSFPQGWEVADGTLYCVASGQGEAGGGGDIITTEQYGNFELKLDWKIAEGGNSGIFYLAQEKCGANGQPIWKSAPEMQILDNA